MSTRNVRWFLILVAVAVSTARRSGAQAPTLPTELPSTLPGSNASILGPPPGSGGARFSDQAAGAGQILGGRPGSSTPRVPTSISTPGGDGASAPSAGVLAIPAVAPLTEVPLYGTLDLPGAEDEGPADGLTFDTALDLMIRQNLELQARRFEIPSARADILTASLRANPILYADSQLVPYGNYSRARPGGPTQYDVNISQPIDYSRKRKRRTQVAAVAEKAVEAQYQDVVRVQIGNLATAYLAVLSARETVRYAEAGLRGLDRVLDASRRLQKFGNRTSADVALIEAQRGAAEVGLLAAREDVRRAKLGLGLLLNFSPDQAEAIEIRASIRDPGPGRPPEDQLYAIALQARPDVAAIRIGVNYAQAGLKLQMANRYADAYLLYQPYTFQNNAPFGSKSATSFAVGVTVPLPVYNRNQGNIERARLNISQTRVQVDALERQVINEVRLAELEYDNTRRYLEYLEAKVLPPARKALADTEKLLESGEVDVTAYLNIQQRFNDVIRQYRDTAVRHRRSMFALNTAVGSRIMP